MNTVYINTSTRLTTIALFDSDTVIAQESWEAKQNEAEKLQPAVDALLTDQKLSPSDVERLVACVGPGGFTSTRVGISAVNAWVFANDIPVAQVTVFDLYPNPDAFIFVTANPKEGWLQKPGEDPQWVTRDGLKLPASFSYTGILDEDWKTYLDERGGTLLELKEQLPDISQLEFSKELVKPWYYKDPHITWSDKNSKLKTKN